MLLFIFTVNFVDISVSGISIIGCTAWELFTGKDRIDGIGITFLIVIAVILLAVNIILQFVEIRPVTKFASRYSERPVNATAWIIIILAVSMIFLPKYIDKKLHK